MSQQVNRREFLKAVPAASVLAYAGARGSEAQTSAKAGSAQIGSVAYRPVPDYPIQPKRYSEVTLKDGFWKPKVDANAAVTIPFEVEKLTEGGRTLGGNVLEAAMLSLRTHPNPAAAGAGGCARPRGRRESPGGGNSGFEVAATYFQTTGKRDLLDGRHRRPPTRCTTSSSATTRRSPAASATRSTASQLYRVTQRQEASRSGEALSRHPRSRELGQPQPAQPVVQAGRSSRAKPSATR